VFYSLQGAIDFAQVHGMLQQLGIRVERFELNKILDTHDKNKDKKLSKDEFEAVRRATIEICNQ
jgi:Ca2+-binding EF-hand superfamily protein